MATLVKSKKGKYGKAILINTDPVRWRYDTVVPTELGEYHYYWTLHKEREGLYLVHEYSYVKSLRKDYMKDVRAFETLSQAIEYADTASKTKSEDAVKSLYKTFGKKKDSDMHPFGL